MPRFRRFSTRLLVMLLGLLFAALGTTYYFVARANYATALAHSEDNLNVGASIFELTIRQRREFLAGSARVMSGDYALRQVIAQDDVPTLVSALDNLAHRVNAPMIALFDAEGNLRASSDGTMENENSGPFRHLFEVARAEDPVEASGFAYLRQQLHVLVVVPLYSPDISAWFGLPYPIDRPFADKLKAVTNLEVTFVSTDDPTQPRVLASTMPLDAAQRVAAAAAGYRRDQVDVRTLEIGAESYVTLFRSQTLLGDDPITIVLQRPLSAELAAARDLQRQIGYIALGALALTALGAFWIARGVSQPVRALAAHTKLVAAGDYETRLHLARSDELGQLAAAFNAMSIGLAERDRVRDLLDKNVSPEIAAQLLRDGAALGGEERDVTILFADLRGFTTLSEQLPAPELLALLNRYLDRMSAEIERHGGVIDKFVGDAIMALFGAPVAQGDAADRALAAAQAMERALAGFNRDLAAERRPPLGIGIGVNTARVVAGNIGSHRRLNYSVIGDGVNVAARLESLTRTPEYRTNLITSAATIAALREPGRVAPRPLGRVQVKGRAGAVEIFAIG